jgi:hypothetical protein
MGVWSNKIYFKSGLIRLPIMNRGELHKKKYQQTKWNWCTFLQFSPKQGSSFTNRRTHYVKKFKRGSSNLREIEKKRLWARLCKRPRSVVCIRQCWANLKFQQMRELFSWSMANTANRKRKFGFWRLKKVSYKKTHRSLIQQQQKIH